MATEHGYCLCRCGCGTPVSNAGDEFCGHCSAGSCAN